jgi:hypothetical protein
MNTPLLSRTVNFSFSAGLGVMRFPRSAKRQTRSFLFDVRSELISLVRARVQKGTTSRRGEACRARSRPRQRPAERRIRPASARAVRDGRVGGRRPVPSTATDATAELGPSARNFDDGFCPNFVRDGDVASIFDLGHHLLEKLTRERHDLVRCIPLRSKLSVNRFGQNGDGTRIVGRLSNVVRQGHDFFSRVPGG